MTATDLAYRMWKAHEMRCGECRVTEIQQDGELCGMGKTLLRTWQILEHDEPAILERLERDAQAQVRAAAELAHARAVAEYHGEREARDE